VCYPSVSDVREPLSRALWAVSLGGDAGFGACARTALAGGPPGSAVWASRRALVRRGALVCFRATVLRPGGRPASSGRSRRPVGRAGCNGAQPAARCPRSADGRCFDAIDPSGCGHPRRSPRELDPPRGGRTRARTRSRCLSPASTSHPNVAGTGPAGVRLIGENRLQQLQEKQAVINTRWCLTFIAICNAQGSRGLERCGHHSVDSLAWPKRSRGAGRYDRVLVK